MDKKVNRNTTLSGSSIPITLIRCHKNPTLKVRQEEYSNMNQRCSDSFWYVPVRLYGIIRYYKFVMFPANCKSRTGKETFKNYPDSVGIFSFAKANVLEEDEE